MRERLEAYNYLALMLDSKPLEAVADLEGRNDSRCVPFYWFSEYDIDSKKVISTVWRARSGFEIIKIDSLTNKVSEHTREMLFHGEDVHYVGLNLETKKKNFYWVQHEHLLKKYDVVTDKPVEYLIDSSPNAMPDKFKLALRSLPDVRFVYWSEKPYGNILGITEPNIYPKYSY